MADKEHRRLEILEKAKDVFAKKGYHDAKIEDIVAAAGIARGTFYLYFQDKRSLFEDLVSRYIDQIWASVSRIDPEREVEAQVVANIASVLDVFLDDPKMARVFLVDATSNDVTVDRRVFAFTEHLTEMVEQALGDGQSLGVVHPGERRVAAHFLVGGMKSVLLELVRARLPVDRQAVTKELYAFFSRGLLTSMGRGVGATATKVAPKGTGRPRRRKQAGAG